MDICSTCFVTTYSPTLRERLNKPALTSRCPASHKFATHNVSSPSQTRRSRLFPTSRADTTTREDELLSALNVLRESAGSTPLHLYRKKHPDKFAAASTAVSALESTGGFGATAGRLRSLLPGTWTLVLTDSKAVESNAGSITGLGSLPGARCTQVEVELEKNGNARTVEKIKVWAGLIDGENALLGKWRLTGKRGTSLEVTYASALLMGKAKIRADSKAVLDCSFCSERLRVGRSESGEFYVFTRNQT